ncbi:hypothetical protein SAMN04487893_10498 [Myroides guanonis]|uniref:Uncharacterized protein n=2 Tax=Myroides guanonis TaxID=1150112 RepID=A0A1I3PEU4_9FLAO|nr:hypothetical protein SAMN04487893_10498 [Myroides guanonis]
MKYLILFSLITLSIACSQKDLIIQNIEKNIGSKISKEVKKVYIINENSIACIKCFNAFISYVQDKELDKDELLIVNNTGNSVDIDSFKTKKNTYIMHDYDFISEPHLGVMYIKNSKTDSILNITPENIMDFITSNSR